MRTVCALSFLVIGLVSSRQAAAYPQFQFSSGTARCTQCHYSPSGGGLLTSWGRDESADTISTLGGNGGFLHGAVDLPKWLALGADIRYALMRHDVGGPASPEFAHFPMQFDLYGRASFTDQISLNVTLGARGIVRPDDGSPAGRLSDTTNRLVSREHYLMWRASASGPYLRLGRFQAPYGIRFAEHVYYVRRYTGFNLYEETYNVSGGYFGEDWEGHVTVFTPPPESFPDPLRSVGYPESGFAAAGEKRVTDEIALGLQTRIGISSEQARYQGGAVGKAWFETAKVLLMGEANFIRQQIKGVNYGQNQFVSYLGATFIPIKGVMAGVAYERFQENLAVKGTGRNAYNLQINFFPYAHIEAVLLGRVQTGGAVGPANRAISDGSTVSTLMFQLHYYL
ncbi:MAG TPA: hypothetical protein VIY56_19480 [Vicinamibacterales bacterium]